MHMKNDFVFVWVVQIDMTLSVGNQIRHDFIVEMKLFPFLCGWSKIASFFNSGRKSLVFSASMQIDLRLVWVVQIALVLVWGIEHDLIPVWDEIGFDVCGLPKII